MTSPDDLSRPGPDNIGAGHSPALRNTDVGISPGADAAIPTDADAAIATDAAERLFDRQPPPEYLSECTGHLAGLKKEKRTGLEAALFFRIGQEWLALDAADLDLIARTRVVRRIPGREGGGLLGLANLDGELLPCGDLGRILGATGSAAAVRTSGPAKPARLVCVASNGERWVFPVDEIAGAGDYHPDDIAPLPATAGRGTGAVTRGIIESRNLKAGLISIAALFEVLNRSVGA